jgi:hypothetical protein
LKEENSKLKVEINLITKEFKKIENKCSNLIKQINDKTKLESFQNEIKSLTDKYLILFSEIEDSRVYN